MIKDFTQALGGATCLAKKLSDVTGETISRERVAMWGVNDNVPYQWRALVIGIARAEGVEVPGEVMRGMVVAPAPADAAE